LCRKKTEKRKKKRIRRLGLSKEFVGRGGRRTSLGKNAQPLIGEESQEGKNHHFRMVAEEKRIIVFSEKKKLSAAAAGACRTERLASGGKKIEPREGKVGNQFPGGGGATHYEGGKGEKRDVPGSDHSLRERYRNTSKLVKGKKGCSRLVNFVPSATKRGGDMIVRGAFDPGEEAFTSGVAKGD